MTAGSSQKSVAARFSAAAETYDRHAVVQARAASKLLSLVPPISSAPAILEIGCGTGILTERLLRRFRKSSFCAIDISGGMILKARKRTGRSSGIRWITGDFRQVKLRHKFDLIISNSCLHWITPLTLTFHRIRSLLAPNGTLAFSIMLRSTLAELHSARAKAAPDKKIRYHLPSAGEVAEALRKSGFRVVSRNKELQRQRFPSASALLKSIHEQGVTGGPFTGRKGLTRSELEQLASCYDTHYKCAGGVFATYETMYVVARRARSN